MATVPWKPSHIASTALPRANKVPVQHVAVTAAGLRFASSLCCCPASDFVACLRRRSISVVTARAVPSVAPVVVPPQGRHNSTSSGIGSSPERIATDIWHKCGSTRFNYPSIASSIAAIARRPWSVTSPRARPLPPAPHTQAYFFTSGFCNWRFMTRLGQSSLPLYIGFFGPYCLYPSLFFRP